MNIHRTSIKSTIHKKGNKGGGEALRNNMSRKRMRGGNMRGGGPSSAISHLATDIFMDGGAKGNVRQKQNFAVFKEFAIKTLNGIDSSVTRFVDTNEVIRPKESVVRDLFTRITELVRMNIHPSKALIRSVIIQDINSSSRRIYTEFMETFLSFDADPDETNTTTKGTIYGNKALSYDKVQKLKNRLRPALEENINAFMKQFIATIESNARKNSRMVSGPQDFVGAQRVAAKSILEYTNKYKQNPALMLGRFVTNLKLSISMHPSVSIDFHVHDNPYIIKNNIARFSRKYFPEMITDFVGLAERLSNPPDGLDETSADSDKEDPETGDDLLRQNNRLFSQFINISNELKPFLQKKKEKQQDADIFKSTTGPDGSPDQEDFRDSIMKGVRRITTSTIIRGLQEIMKMTGEGSLPFTGANIKKSLNTMQSKLTALKTSVNDPQTMEYLTKTAELCSEITDIITDEFKGPIAEGADKMLEIGFEASAKLMGKLSKFSLNMIKLVPVFGDIFIIAENSLAAISAGVSAVRGALGIADQGVKTAKNIGTTLNNPKIQDKFNNFKEFYSNFISALSIDDVQGSMAKTVDVVANAIDPPVPTPIPK